MNTTDLTNELASLMGLHPGELPAVEINKKSAPYRLIGQLARQNYIPSYQDTPDDLKWLVKGEEDCQPDPSIHIIDLLGVYQSGNNKVVLYDLLIQLCALQLEVDYEGLRTVVLLHELSHAVTHRGLDSDNRIWECFNIADKRAKEYFAQIYTYKFLQNTEQSYLAIMNKLSEVQPGVYQTYQESIGKEIGVINEELLATRYAVPDGFQPYSPMLLRENWEIRFDNLESYRSPKLLIFALGANTRQQYETISKGTKFSITANEIRIRSYDYSPSNYGFSDESTLDVYRLILDNLEKIREKSTTRSQQKPLFSIVFGSDQYYLNLADSFAHDLWKEIVDIIENDYSVLSRVLRRYRFDGGP